MKHLIAALLLTTLTARAQPGECQAPTPVQHALEGGEHVPNCLPVTYSHYPPTSGKHYPVWGNFKSYDLVISPGYYLHDEEHGAVVMLINCHTAGSCDQDRARLQAIADAFPRDSLCDATVKHRLVIAGDTVMDTRFALVAWGWSLKSDCIDSAAFRAFMDAHYGHGPEDFCISGTDFVGAGYCVAPLGLEAPALSKAARASLPPNTLWQGSLDRRGSLSLEVVSPDGAFLAAYDLGQAGPGPARAVWDAAAFRRGHPAAGAVVCRVKMKNASGTRLLAESLAFP